MKAFSSARFARPIAPALILALVGAAPPAAQPALPAPSSILGFEPCADYKLATYERIADYFRALAAAAPERMRLVEIGRTSEDRPQLMAVISSEQNLRDLDALKDIARTLALGRDGGNRPITDEQARALARRGKAVVWIDFGLHSSEVAPAQTAPLMAFTAVSSESDEMRGIRDDVIFLLVPNMNPDGTTMVADWYARHANTPWQERVPELWHAYVGHDNNRDWFMMTQRETRNVARQLYAEWFPQVIYNHHQTAPYPARIFVPPFADPINPNIPALVVRGVNMVGSAMTRRLDQEGKRGAISRIGFDAWWNGGMRTAPYFHNMVGILTETAHSSPAPAFNDQKTFPRTFDNGVPTLEPTVDYPSPYLGGEWRLRDSCDYMVTASMAVLDIAAKRRQEWLFDIYQMGRHAVVANAKETFLVPVDQWDRGTAVKMINALRLGGVDVERATAPFRAAGKGYPAGTYVIRAAQPFGPYVRDLLTPQVYPEIRRPAGGLPPRPYDITGWTLSYQMGVQVDHVMEEVTAATGIVDVAPVPAASVPPRARAFALDPRANDSFTAVNRLLRAGNTVYRTASPVVIEGREWPPGAFLVEPGPAATPRVSDAARTLGLTLGALDARPADAVRVRQPRIALYHGWGGNMDEGWTRWVLEQFEFPYSRLHDADVRAGNLDEKYDAVVLPDASYQQMRDGLSAGTMPPEYTGGMTERGIDNLREFVSKGGTVVAMDSATELPMVAFGLPIRNVAAQMTETDFYVPGALLRLETDAQTAVGFGMPEASAAFFYNGPAFELLTTAGAPGVHVVARYAPQRLLMSGWIRGEQLLTGRPAVVVARLGRGRVVLLGFRTQHRAQPHGTFKLLFNSLLLSSLQ